MVHRALLGCSETLMYKILQSLYMVLHKIEQYYLLTMLKNNRQFPEKKPNNFYRIMRNMVKKDMVFVSVRDNGKKIYRLTNYGWAIACCIAKDFDTPKEYKQYARVVELWIT